MNTQQEIQFFWPLTEQIPLALDYSNCEKQKIWLPINSTGTFLIGTGGTVTSSSINTTSSFELRNTADSVGAWQLYDGFKVHRPEKPKYFVRFFTKLLLGWEWKDK
jgi:hypothetical protein